MAEQETVAETRSARKERTRRAILDATLAAAGESSLSTVSLRRVAREAGIVPTGFYRHFSSLDEVGLALVDESFASLRQMLRDVRRGSPDLAGVIRGSVAILADVTRIRAVMLSSSLSNESSAI